MLDLGGKYALTTEYGRSSLAWLYRGFRCSDGAPVLAKLQRADLPSLLELARFRHDYDLLASLQLPSIGRACSLETFKNGLAVVIEDPGEMSLHAWLRSTRPELPLALDVALALTRAVRQLHELHIIHNDVRPQHFFLSASQPARLTWIDFGRATRLAHGTRAHSTAVQLDESLGYAAPEHTGRMNRVVDKRSDLYSLGVTLYELFCGKLPFEASDPLELVHCHLARQAVPPHAIDPALPTVLSQLVSKLLAKTAEDRYQSAAGVERDLERIAAALGRGTSPELSLAAEDASGELTIPQKLYGRDAALAELGALTEAAASGMKRFCLLAGESGIGKSALVAELALRVPVGRFARGKFDALQRATPYFAIVQACRDVLQTALAEGEERVTVLREALGRNLGANAQVLIELVPELGLVLGAQAPVPHLGALEAQRRFEDVFQGFVRALATPGAPLVLVLDDLQWADAASLGLIQLLLQSRGVSCLLLLGTYRSNEVSALHPLALLIDELGRQRLGPCLIELGPLVRADIVQLLADTFGASAAEVEPLAHTLLAKTQGSPFFIAQFLHTLERSGALIFDRAACAWRWDMARVQAQLATENVVEVVLKRLRSLPLAAESVLRRAACIGHAFDMHTLAMLAADAPGELGSGVWQALEAGLIVPLDASFRYARSPLVASGAGINARFQFLHDRVRQAAYSLLGEDERRHAHLALGRALLATTAADAPRDERLFEIVDHLNRARSLIGDGAEQRQLAVLNVRAATRARDAAAASASTAYAAVALELFGADAWESAPQLVYQLHLLKAECEYQNGKLDAALEPLDAIESRASALSERATAWRLRCVILTNQGRLADACEAGASAVRRLGLEVPPIGDTASFGPAIRAAFGRFGQALGERAVESLAELPPMTDPERLALIEILTSTVPAAYQSNTELAVFTVLEGARASIEHGNAPHSPFFYCQYAIVHIAATGDIRLADRFGALGVALAARPEHRVAASAVHFLWAGFIAHWCRPYSTCFEHFRKALELGLELGDYVHASYSVTHRLGLAVLAGQPLAEIAHDIDDSWELIARTGDQINRAFISACARLTRALTHHTLGHSALDLEPDPRESSGELPSSVLALYVAGEAMVRVLAGDFAAALDATERVPPLPGIFYVAPHRLYHGLALAGLARQSEGAERESLLTRLRADVATFAPWVAACPQNQAAARALLQAELRALEGAPLEALELYDTAIESAREHGLLHLQALGSERCAELYLSRGRGKLARAYLSEAQYLYERWGAGARAAQLATRYPQLLDARAAHPFGVAHGQPGLAPGADPARATLGRLDVATALCVAQAISTELDLGRAVERALRTLAASAGAQRARLLLHEQGTLRLAAELDIDPDRVRVELGQPLDPTQLPLLVVQYVAQTREAVVLGDASLDPKFRRDPYIRARRPRSVLCAPMLHQGQLGGVLYLEHDGATDAFDPDRCELLQFLAAQSAIAIENARLYGALQAATARLQQANQNLEREVRDRTEQLRRTLADLWSEMDLARKIQTVLLPGRLVAPGYRLAAHMQPADSMGGDYYDLVHAAGKTWVMIGDASGHGVSAGLVMMLIQTAIGTVLRTSPDPLSPALVLTRTNAAVLESLRQIGGDQYMTLSVLELGPRGVRHAGLHQDILVYRAQTGQVERVETAGVWLGVLDDISDIVTDAELPLAPGDTLLLFTDGLTEQRVGDGLLGTDGLARHFAEAAATHAAPRAIVSRLFATLSNDKPKDDMTLMVMRHDPSVSHEDESP